MATWIEIAAWIKNDTTRNMSHDLIILCLNRAMLARISKDRWGLIVSRLAVKAYMCVSERVSISVQVCLSSWTVSQIQYLSLMSNWEEQKEHTEHHMTS